MSSQADDANAHIRKVMGADADKAAAAVHNLTVLPGSTVGGDGGGAGEKKPEAHWMRLPTVNWTKSAFAREVGQIMAAEEMFQRDGVAVMVDPESGRINALTAQRLITELETWFVFYKLKAADEVAVKMPMSMQVDTARFLLEASDFVNRLRRIDRVNKVRMPVIRADGRPVLLPEGYDEESRIYTLKSGLVIDEDMPLEKGKAITEHYLKEFPFEDERSKDVQICMMASMFGTCMLPLSTPRMHGLWRANDRGTGKSLLAEMCIAPVHGLPASADIGDKKKLGEVFDSAALQSESYIFFDNLEGLVKNPMIDGFLTSKSRRVRLFHTQKTEEAVPGTIVLFTGNNLDVSPDIDRRTLMCRLLLKEFDLQDRRIENVINVEKLIKPAVRQEMLGALWALVRNWAKAGCPPAKTADGRTYQIPSFERWSDIFGGIVQAAGYGNPLVKPSDALSAVPERVHQRRLVEMLANKINVEDGKKRYVVSKFQELVDVCFEQDLFPYKMEGTIHQVGPDDNTHEEFSAKPSTLSWLGRFMSGTVCGSPEGREYTLPPLKAGGSGRRVRIGYLGQGRGRTYWVELLG